MRRLAGRHGARRRPKLRRTRIENRGCASSTGRARLESRDRYQKKAYPLALTPPFLVEATNWQRRHPASAAPPTTSKRATSAALATSLMSNASSSACACVLPTASAAATIASALVLGRNDFHKVLAHRLKAVEQLDAAQALRRVHVLWMSSRKSAPARRSSGP